MARIRNIKPEFFTDPVLGMASRDARYFYWGMLPLMDCNGVVECSPALFKVKIFPYDHDIGIPEIEGFIQELQSLVRIIIFKPTLSSKDRFKVLLWCPKFTTHQVISERERQQSKVLDVSRELFRELELLRTQLLIEFDARYSNRIRLSTEKYSTGTVPVHADIGHRTLDIKNSNTQPSVVQANPPSAAPPLFAVGTQKPKNQEHPPLVAIEVPNAIEGNIKGPRRSRSAANRSCPFDLEAAYAPYPRKEGKAEGFRLLAKQLVTEELYEQFCAAVRHYVADLKAKGTPREYVFKFHNFAAKHWRDWISPNESPMLPAAVAANVSELTLAQRLGLKK